MLSTAMSRRFAHRHNKDGSHDSICTSCAVTVASVQDEDQLCAHESGHVCNPETEYRFNEEVSSHAL